MNESLFIPGSEWLYFKLYTGVKNTDHILVHSVLPFIKLLKAEKLVSDAFFIRYSDPDFHIRLRLHCRQDRYSEVFSFFYREFQSIVAQKKIWDVRCCCYQRETERYGDCTIEYVEKLFDLDSEMIMTFLACLESKAKPDEERFIFSLILTDWFLNLCDYDFAGKQQYVHSNGEMILKYSGEYGTQQFKLMNEKYRKYKRLVESSFTEKRWADWLDTYAGRMKEYLSCIENNLSGNSRYIPMDSLVVSFIHMTLDRLFVSHNKAYELLIYYFLDKYYCSLQHKLQP